MAKRIREAGTLAPTESGPGKRLLTLITPGRGSSGDYTVEMLKRAAEEKVFPRGTQGHIDHDSRADQVDKPEGSLRNLALYLNEDAYWDAGYVDPDTGEKGRLAAESVIGSAWRPFVDDFAEILGVSINALAEVADDGSIGRLIPDPFNRADLVTVAGRGGRVGEAREAARVIESRSMRAVETTNGDRNGWLSKAVYDAHGTDGTYVWFEDFDDQYVYYSTDERYATRTYRQAYTVEGSTVTLSGDPEPVRRRTEYDPITQDSPVNPAGVAEKKEAATMATIDDAELQTLRENSGRVTALETENKTLADELATERQKAAEAATEARQDAAARAVKEAFGEDAPAYHLNAARLAATASDFDAEKFAAEVKEAAAAVASANGAGNPSGVGDTISTSTTESANTDRTADIVSLRV